MPKTFAFLIIGLFFGFGAGFLVAASTGSQLQGHDHAEAGGDAAHDHAAHDHGEGGHDHSEMTEVSGPAPELTLTIHPDGAQSRNLHIGVTNFAFDPEGVNGPNVPGKGHAHVYVNGIKQARAYGPWVQLYALPKGEHEVRVSLNANDHSALAVEGEPIEATITVVIE
jgi:hypothetical protein